jgi:deoxycytidine triphosphate deaminase
MAVLSHNGIKGRFAEIFAENGDPHNIDAAKYYLTLGERFLILPAGDKYPASRPRRTRFVIEPGQTAFLSSAERVAMPRDLIGIIGPRYENAEQGILFFGGMLVDPGYGVPAYDSDEPFGQPLTFSIANVGSSSLELRPGEDKIASLAFLEVAAPLTNREIREGFVRSSLVKARVERFDDGHGDQPLRPLGLVENLSQIQVEVEKLKASVNQVVLFGVIVLAVTLVAALTTTIFSLTGELHGSTDLSNGEPLWKVLCLTLGAAVGAVALVIGLFYLCVRFYARAIGLRRIVRLRG